MEQLSIATVDKKRDFSARTGFHRRDVPWNSKSISQDMRIIWFNFCSNSMQNPLPPQQSEALLRQRLY